MLAGTSGANGRGPTVAIERFLIDLVHMEEGIGGAIVKGGVLNILADETRSFLVAAAEKIGAGVMVIVSVLVCVLEF